MNYTHLILTDLKMGASQSVIANWFSQRLGSQQEH
ncbi:MAG: hypothetical protein MRERC_1c030 [Mycoplasmataceae bacterium RC_NB112A]|nr:MAG: hypothetical protein MRERC_10c014 [Mycoplasmataceae bacterium RC_NB112A]KLL02449.1 MAG: hypothetical protein MRERC_1c030 [Mycoplasmataceae bacterium RC_NB112A]